MRHCWGTTPAGPARCSTRHPVRSQITTITTITRHGAAAGRARHRPRSLKTARVEVRSSPGTSTSTRNPQPTPTHPHSTRKSQFDRGPGSARGRLRHVRTRGAAPEDERIKRDGQGPARPGRPAPRATPARRRRRSARRVRAEIEAPLRDLIRWGLLTY